MYCVVQGVHLQNTFMVFTINWYLPLSIVAFSGWLVGIWSTIRTL